MTPLFLFVRPPRPLWPFNGPSSAVWPPLAFASLAAALREALPDMRVAILDAPALKMGWKSLERELCRQKPAYVGMGEEAASCVEGLRLARLAKTAGARVIAGGCFFGHVAEEVIKTGWVDAVVHGEGEVTLVELVQALRSGLASDLAAVTGITYAHGDEAVRTPPRPLIGNLDCLPMPAYDLLPVAHYGRGSRNHPDLAAIELSRGCMGSCSFCVLWRQMGETRNAQVVPHYRIKSPERVLAEVQRLTRHFGRRYLGWVDPCFNAHPTGPARVSELLLRNNLRIGQSAWVRADGLVRDAESGALRTCVDSGLNEVYIGLERGDAESLARLNKGIAVADNRRALDILAHEFPEIFVVGSLIYGLPGDTPETARALHQLTMELPLDYAFLIPLARLPGTDYWDPQLWDATGERFRDFNFLPLQAHRDGARLTRALIYSMLFNWTMARLRNYGRSLLHRDARHRRLLTRLAWRGALFQLRWLWNSLGGNNSKDGMLFPAWYET